MLIIFLVFGILTPMLYFTKHDVNNSIQLTPRISNAQAIEAVEEYLDRRVNGFETISIYYPESTPADEIEVRSRYYPTSDFLASGFDLPLRYYHPNATLFFIKGDERTKDYNIVGRCMLTNEGDNNNGMSCSPLDQRIWVLLTGHLVYLVDTEWDGALASLPDGFFVDSTSGELLFSTFTCSKERDEWCKEDTIRVDEWGIN